MTKTYEIKHSINYFYQAYQCCCIVYQYYLISELFISVERVVVRVFDYPWNQDEVLPLVRERITALCQWWNLREFRHRPWSYVSEEFTTQNQTFENSYETVLATCLRVFLRKLTNLIQ